MHFCLWQGILPSFPQYFREIPQGKTVWPCIRAKDENNYPFWGKEVKWDKLALCWNIILLLWRQMHRKAQKTKQTSRKTRFVSMVLTAVCNLAAFKRQQLASSYFKIYKQKYICVRLFMTVHMVVFLVTVRSSFDWIYQILLNRRQRNRKAGR